MKNSALLVVAYFLSKYDAPREPRASNQLGYSNVSSAFEGIAQILGFPKNTVKNVRDTFDQIHPNREGWKYGLRPQYKKIANSLQSISEHKLAEVIKKILTDKAYRDSEKYLIELGIENMNEFEDLPTLYKELQNKNSIIQSCWRDFKLSQECINEIQKNIPNNRQLTFYGYTTKLLIPSSEGKVYFPNMVFIQAAAALPLYRAIEEYNSVYKKVFEKLKGLGLTRNQNNVQLTDTKFHELLVSQSSGSLQQKFLNVAEEVLKEMGKFSTSNLIKFKEFSFNPVFVTGTDSWGKRPGRPDVSNTSILNALGLQHVSSGYYVELVDILAANDVDWDELLNDSGVDSEVISKQVGVNQIVYGAPGTGKSYTINQNLSGTLNTITTVFHSETQNSDFVGSLRPVTVNDEVFYKFVPGPFIKAFISAIKLPNENFYLLIEEINRGNAASIFGEIFQLLDRKPDGQSAYKIHPDETLDKYLSEELGDLYKHELYIPSNLSLLATMNNSDQGVFSLDAAFKRRWSFKYVPIDFSDGPEYEFHIDGIPCSWKTFAKSINGVLKQECQPMEEDRLLGQWFVSQTELINNFDEVFTGKILTYLWSDVLRHHGREKVFNSMEVQSFGDLVKVYYRQKEGEDIKLFSEFMHDELLKFEKIIPYGNEASELNEEDDES